MASSINQLVESVGLSSARARVTKWNNEVESSSIGIYFLSPSNDPNSASSLYPNAPIDENILNFWIKKVPTIKIDGKPATVEKLKLRLESFWLPDENILYIGQTESGKGLKGRIKQYYDTELGERKPHAGGHWIKTLTILKDLFVHYIPCQHPQDKEKKIMRQFVSHVSESTLEKLYDPNLPLPFANLELERGYRKNHGISKSKLGDD
jgi:hypothetical protein